MCRKKIWLDGRLGAGRFIDGKPGDEENQKMLPLPRRDAKRRDLIFARYAP
jgi:hypothetical protein